MQVMYVNNDGGGFADDVEIEAGTSVSRFFQQHMSHGRPEDFLIRVNRQPVAADYVLQQGDRITITPTKIQGAVL